jgi:heme a synthase
MAALAKTLFAATFLLLIAGGLVTSTDSGLSVPDWPTTYGQNMFTFPPSHWVGGIRFEHSHRLIAATVGFLTVCLALWILLADRRRWMKVLAGVAVFAVCLQGLLGGLTVRYFLPTPISVAHACLAQTFFCLTLALAIFTSKTWSAGAPPRQSSSTLGRNSLSLGTSEADSRSASRPSPPAWAIATFAVLFVQLALGAWMRHSAAGLAIPDFPSSFGRFLPDHWDSKIAVHFAHRAWAPVVAVTVFACARVVLRESTGPGARRSARILAALLPVQIVLGAFSIWTRKAVPVTVAHQTLGAVLLACAAGLAIFVSREEYSRKHSERRAPARLAAGGAR